MAAEAVIGTVFTFQVIFVDATNVPVVVLNPQIEVFGYDQTGTKVVYIALTPLVVDPTEVGRYLYPFTISTTFVDGDTIYGSMTGTDPTTGDLARVEQVVNSISPNRATGGGGGCEGLRVQFIKSPFC